jgi:ribosomal protein L40E
MTAPAPSANTDVREHPTKPCPRCGQRIPLGTAKCGRCGSSLVPGRAEKLARDRTHAGRYRVGMRITATCLVGFGILGIVVSFLGMEGSLAANLGFSGIFVLLGAGALTLRRWINYIVLVYFLPVTAIYAYLAFDDISPVSIVAAATGALFTFLAFFNLNAHKQSIIAGVDPIKKQSDD